MFNINLEKKIKEISKEEKQEIISMMKKAGYDFANHVVISNIRSVDKTLHNYLCRKTRHAGKKSKIKWLLDELGFKVNGSNELIDNIKEKLKKVYTPEIIKNHIENNTPLLNHQGVIKKIKIINNYLLRRSRYKGNDKEEKFPSFRQILNSLYKKYPYLGCMVSRKVYIEDFSFKEVNNILTKKYYKGEDISFSGLKYFQKGYLLKWLMLDSKDQGVFEGFEKKTKDTSSSIERITGIKKINFSIKNAKKVKNFGNLGEYFTKINLLATLAIDPTAQSQTKLFREIYNPPLINVYPIDSDTTKIERGVKLTFVPPKEDDKLMYADSVVESLNDITMVEVKRLTYPSPHVIEDIKKKFNSKRKLHWSKQNKNITEKALIIHSKKPVFDEIFKHLTGDNISIMGYKSFRKSLEISLEQMESQGYLKTQLYCVDDLLRMYDLIVNFPHILLRKNHIHQYRFLNNTLQDLIKNLKNRKIDPQPETIKLYSKKGKLINNKKGTFERFLFSVNDLPVEKNNSNCLRYVKKRIKKIPKSTLYLDIETMGFMGKAGNPLFLVGMGYKRGDDLKFDLAFARNPWEEEAVLEYVSGFMSKFKEIITYNGRTFDLPFIKDRLVAHMMKNKITAQHTDLYFNLKSTKELKNIKSRKLIHIAELLGDRRKDKPGSDMPKIYSEWLRTANPEVIKQDLEHNVMDLVDTVTAYLSPELYK